MARVMVHCEYMTSPSYWREAPGLNRLIFHLVVCFVSDGTAENLPELDETIYGFKLPEGFRADCEQIKSHSHYSHSPVQ